MFLHVRKTNALSYSGDVFLPDLLLLDVHIALFVLMKICINLKHMLGLHADAGGSKRRGNCLHLLCMCVFN